MSMLSSNKRSSREPTERAVINRDVIVDLWVNEDKVSWSLSRVNPTNSRGYRTLKPENIKEVVQAISALARVFSGLPSMSQGYQKYAAMLADELEALLANLGDIPTADQAANGETQSVLLSAQR